MMEINADGCMAVCIVWVPVETNIPLKKGFNPDSLDLYWTQTPLRCRAQIGYLSCDNGIDGWALGMVRPVKN